jgi:CRP-like cAMP-binding protein
VKRSARVFKGRNRILARLPSVQWKRLESELESVEMPRRTSLYEPNRPFDYVYFPETGVASILTVLRDGTETEVAAVGYEGMVGLAVFFGAETISGRACLQIPGKAFRLKAEVLRRETKDGGALADALRRYAQGQFTQVAYTVSCNRSHSIQQRTARWLLMAHDRVASDPFELTHEFLSQMLGVRRSGVSEVMGALQKARVLRYSRGIVTILNRKRLEAISCECYGIVSDEFRRLLE